MSRRSAAATKIGAATVAVAALGFLGLAPVGAHTDSLFTALRVADGEGGSQFATVSKTDANVTALAESLPNYVIISVEIFGEQGYAILQNELGYSITTWNHETGAAGTPVAISAPSINGEIRSVYTLDTLSDGTIISFVEFDGDENDPEWVVSIDPTTGVATGLIDMTDRESADFIDSIATDPTTGVTYALVDENDGIPEYIILDLAGGTYSGPFELTAMHEAFGNGWPMAADFDASGTLWFYYHQRGDDEGPGEPGSGEIGEVTSGDVREVGTSSEFAATSEVDQLASTTAAFGPAVTVVSSGYVSSADGTSFAAAALTVDPAAVIKPALASTGTPVEAIAATGLGLLAVGGVALIAFSRRRTA